MQASRTVGRKWRSFAHRAMSQKSPKKSLKAASSKSPKGTVEKASGSPKSTVSKSKASPTSLASKKEENSKATPAKTQENSKATPAKAQEIPKEAPLAKSLGCPKSAGTKSAMTQQSTTTTCTTKSKVSHLYERVKPRTFFQGQTWADRTGLAAGRQWWRQKARKERIIVLTQLLVFFCIVLILIASLIIFGAYMVLKKLEAASKLDNRLTTKTTLCRQQYSDVEPECITEDPSQRHECALGARLCHMVWWEFQKRDYGINFQNLGSRYEKVKNVTTRIYFEPLNNTEHADCGNEINDPHWCLGGNCQRAKVHPNNWYRSIPYPTKDGNYVVRDIHKLPCLTKESGSETAFNDFVSAYVGSCGNSSCENHCNDKICGEGSFVKYGLRVGLFHCDLTLDQVEGTRGFPCISPVKVFNCSRCPSYDMSTNRKNVQENIAKKKCVNLEFSSSQCAFTCNDSRIFSFPDGMTCTADNKRPGACMMGHCYNLERPKSEKDQKT